jgi:hypothetical protein
VYVHCGLICLVAFTIHPLSPGEAYPGPNPSPSIFDKCQCSAIGYSLVGACATCQGGKSAECDHIVSFLNSLELMDLSFPKPFCIYGQLHNYSISCAVSSYGGRESVAFDIEIVVPRFPNPVPSGVYVPYWATLDVAVCFLSFSSMAT